MKCKSVFRLIILILLNLFYLGEMSYSSEIPDIEKVIKHNLLFRDTLLINAKNYTHPYGLNQLDQEEKMGQRLASLYHEDYEIRWKFITKRYDLSLRVSQDDSYEEPKPLFDLYHGEIRANYFSINSKVKDKIKRTLTFKYYRSNMQGMRPLIFILPPIAGENIVNTETAFSYAKNKMDVVLMDVPDFLNVHHSIDEVADLMTHYLIGLRQLVHHFTTRADMNINQEKIAVFGISLGAGIASIMVGIEPKIKYAYLVVGGGNLADIMLNSQQERIVSFRENKLNHDEAFYFLNEDEKNRKWFNLIREKFIFDPIYFANNIDDKKVYMVMSTNDQVIPFRDQLELWNAFNQPRYILSQLNHISTVVRWFIQDHLEVIDFIKE